MKSEVTLIILAIFEFILFASGLIGILFCPKREIREDMDDLWFLLVTSGSIGLGSLGIVELLRMVGMQ